MNSQAVNKIHRHTYFLGWAKRQISLPHVQLKCDNDEKGSIPPSAEQHLKLERPVSQTASQLHKEPHLRIKTGIIRKG